MNKILHRFYFLFGFLILTASCSKKTDVKLSSSADILNYSFPGLHAETHVNAIMHNVTIQFDDTLKNGSSLIASFGLSGGATASIQNILQSSNQTPNNFESDLTYTITAQDKTSKQDWHVWATNNSYSYYYGLGHFIKSATGNNRDYDWYIDQMNSGVFNSVNCGPSSTTMAMKWSDSGFNKTAEDARNKYESAGGWWFTSDVDNYLNDYAVPHVIIQLKQDAAQTRQQLTAMIDSGYIIILCIDMDYVTPAVQESYRVGKFYPTTPKWGHFFVIKGYRQVDSDFFFEIYDPYSWGETDNDGTLKGKNRYYSYHDVFAAASNWWDFAFIVSKKGQPVNVSTISKAVDAKQIRHAPGM